jgi:hypothetical protein
MNSTAWLCDSTEWSILCMRLFSFNSPFGLDFSSLMFQCGRFLFATFMIPSFIASDFRNLLNEPVFVWCV